MVKLQFQQELLLTVRVEITTHRTVSSLEWDSKKQLCTAKGTEARELNNHLAVIKGKMIGCYSKLEFRDEFITAEAIKKMLTPV